MDENAAGQVIVEPAAIATSEAPPPVNPTESNTEKPSGNAPSEMEKRFADGFFNARNPVQPQAAPKAAEARTSEVAAAAQPSGADAPAPTYEPEAALSGEQAAAETAAAANANPALTAEAAQQQQPETGNPPVPPRPRDWVAEWKELADAHPEVVGKPMPDDIYKACLSSEQTPLRVYESMMLTKLSSEIDALKAENATLRQNAESGARAPVTPSTGGANPAAEDAFLRGFNLRYGH